VIRRAGYPDGEYLHCELPDGTIARIPVWMVDATVCSAHLIGQAEVSLAARKDLRQLLDALHQPQGGDVQSKNASPLEVEHEQSTVSNPSSASAVANGGDASITSGSYERATRRTHGNSRRVAVAESHEPDSGS
jgi:hypothetical protein